MSIRSIHLVGSCALVVLCGLALGCGDAGRLDTACKSNADCSATQYCATGLCEGGVGVCTERPTMCEDNQAFVCGCDQQTYVNECEADMAGVRLATTGPCVCGDNGDCVQGQFCQKTDSCLNPGFCVPIPQTCDPMDTQAVCGCDGVNYGNACEAAQAGQRVSLVGLCDQPPCYENQDCEATEFCKADVCDGPGFCEARPTMCTPDPADNVDGCDGVVYDSECAANAEGIRVRPEI